MPMLRTQADLEIYSQLRIRGDVVASCKIAFQLRSRVDRQGAGLGGPKPYARYVVETKSTGPPPPSVWACRRKVVGYDGYAV